MNLEQMVNQFKALSDLNRLKILSILRNGEQCACVLLEQLDLSQSGLSYHMKILVDSGLVSGRPEGKWTYYQIVEPACQVFIQNFTDLTQLTDETKRVIYSSKTDCKKES